MRRPRIGTVAPMLLAFDPMADAFDSIWPEADHFLIADETLYADFATADPRSDDAFQRVSDLLHYAATTRCDALVFTGSVFGEAVERAREGISIPVLTSYEAMIEEAFEAGGRLGILATAPESVVTLSTDIEREAKRKRVDIKLGARVVAEARAPILSGDVDTHDRIVAEAAATMTDRDCLMFAQVSMASAAKSATALSGCAVLTPPEATVRKLRRLCSQGSR